MPPWTYRQGLQEIGNGVFAYLQPNGSWGWSNAGLVTSGDKSLLIDTLFDLPLTQRMLDEMRKATPAANAIETVVNTHANGDHCWGNQLVGSAQIVSSRRSAEEMRELPPSLMATLVGISRLTIRLGAPGKALMRGLGRLGLRKFGAIGEAADLVADAFGAFHFRGIRLVLPTRTFEGALTLQAGDRTVQLLEVGPAHTRGDLIVHLPAERVLFSGDVLFNGGHPLMWAGPVSNWIAACDRILGLDIDVIVPGHGPIADKALVKRVKEYWELLDRETRARFKAGQSAEEAVHDISLAGYADWADAERIAINVATLYRELAGDKAPADAVQAFASMAKFRRSPRS
jgi:glyoxylase-like metal-dependent hydrolase (beta-lactamase superfamily II)